MLFQSSSDPKAGCYGPTCDILIEAVAGFNPHPTRKPDATWRLRSDCPEASGFNPHPTRKPDATRMRPSVRFCEANSFNPHPTRKPDATYELPDSPTPYADVSILIRPESRMLHTAQAFHRLTCNRFNPHPTRKPDATMIGQEYIHSVVLFQSSSDPKAGCYESSPRAIPPISGVFQSSSDPKAGCYCPIPLEIGD